MNTVAEIKDGVDKLSPPKRAELESLLWPDWDRAEGDTPANVPEELAEAAKGRFLPGDRSNPQANPLQLGVNPRGEESEVVFCEHS